MSRTAVGAVLNLQLPPTEKLVAVVLADHANVQTLETRPSIQRIVLLSGLGERSVRRSLRHLESSGVISVVTPGGPPDRATLYRLNIPEWGHMAPNSGAREYQRVGPHWPPNQRLNQKPKSVRGHAGPTPENGSEPRAALWKRPAWMT